MIIEEEGNSFHNNNNKYNNNNHNNKLNNHNHDNTVLCVLLFYPLKYKHKHTSSPLLSAKFKFMSTYFLDKNNNLCCLLY